MARYRNLALFLLLAAVWGSAFVAIKAGLAYFPPVLFAAIRYDIAAVLAHLALAASALGYLVYFDLLDRLGPIAIDLVRPISAMNLLYALIPPNQTRFEIQRVSI